MLYIKENSPSDAWKKALIKLLEEGEYTPENKYYRDSAAIIEIENVNENLYNEDFPMSKDDIEVINNYLIHGTNEEKMKHDWTKIYRKRLFGEDNNQIEKIIDYLQKKPNGKRAQASIWKHETDFKSPIAPCLQIIWFKIIDHKLNIHVHMRASNCYNKLLMNINEFIFLQKYVAKKLQIECGPYLQFCDSLHIDLENEKKVNNLLKK